MHVAVVCSRLCHKSVNKWSKNQKKTSRAFEQKRTVQHYRCKCVTALGLYIRICVHLKCIKVWVQHLSNRLILLINYTQNDKKCFLCISLRKKTFIEKRQSECTNQRNHSTIFVLVDTEGQRQSETLLCSSISGKSTWSDLIKTTRRDWSPCLV